MFIRLKKEEEEYISRRMKMYVFYHIKHLFY